MFSNLIHRISILLSIIFFGISSIQAQDKHEEFFALQSWDALLQKAQKENKKILIDCFFTGCAPCAMMDKMVFPNPNIKALLASDYIFTKVDILKDEIGMQVMAKYGVSGFPTFLVLNQKGQLMSYWYGFQDVGQMYQLLETRKNNHLDQGVLSGFSTKLSQDYPGYYQQYYAKENRKTDSKAASEWLQKQSDWTKEIPAMTLLKFRKLGPVCDSFVLLQYHQLRNLYGESLCIDRSADILTESMRSMLNANTNDKAFHQFLSNQQSYFPEQDWQKIRHVLGNSFYLNIRKDTLALLQFMNTYPILYMNYAGSLFSNMQNNNQLNAENLTLWSNWVQKNIHAESSISSLRMAQEILTKAGNAVAAASYAQMERKQQTKWQ